jgi:CheY-like chemotaxis protein
MSAQFADVVPLTLLEPSTRGLILHVDDDEAVRRSTAFLLRAAGFDTREAATARQALAQIDALRGHLDVLIVDYHLDDDMTGTDVAEEFARLLGHAVPTLILTGDPANACVPMLTDAPVWVARKPMNPDTLLAALPSLVSFRRALAG